MRVVLLDGFAVEVPGATDVVENLPRSVQRLIAHVTLSGRPGRGATAGQLWPDVAEASAQGCLRSTLWRLRRSLPGLIEVAGGALRLATGVSVDVHDLSGWAHGMLGPRTDLEELHAPEVAFRGELLPGWYDDWILVERECLRQLRAHALEVLADRLLRVGRLGEAVQIAIGAVRAEPLRESAHRAVIRVHLAEGNVSDALRQYECFRDLIADELGVAPSPQMQQLVSGIRLSGARRRTC